MFNWTKNFYKKDYSIPLTMVLVFVVYWFVKTAVKHSAATPFVWSKGIYDEIFSIAFVFIFFRVVFLKTKSIQKFIFYQHSFLWLLTKIIWFVSIVWLWIFLSFEIPKITNNIIYKATDLPVYVIDPCSYWTEELDRYASWTKEEESEALKFWKIDDVWGFDSKCAPREFERDEQY